mmetsp:Transcript_39334/g.123470  ORF Transcript_39334/g.123470 Transcript_39334/m.123470 type:complete len:260 (+) Transcript_39334:146-925(+)
MFAAAAMSAAAVACTRTAAAAALPSPSSHCTTQTVEECSRTLKLGEPLTMASKLAAPLSRARLAAELRAKALAKSPSHSALSWASTCADGVAAPVSRSLAAPPPLSTAAATTPEASATGLVGLVGDAAPSRAQKASSSERLTQCLPWWPKRPRSSGCAASATISAASTTPHDERLKYRLPSATATAPLLTAGSARHSSDCSSGSEESSARVRSRLKPHGARRIRSASASIDARSMTLECPPLVPCTIEQPAACTHSAIQ